MNRTVSYAPHLVGATSGKGFTTNPQIRGFTIVEVAMATFVLALAIASAIITLQRGFQSLDTARNTTIAGQIMQSELEKLRLRDWSEIAAFPTTGPVGPVTIDASFTENSFIGNRFKLYRDVKIIATGTTSGMREITLTCEWENYDGRQLSRSYSIYYGQNGLYDYFYNYY